ncbi:bacillithiol system redox-active protein YtxJ [Flavobacterium turcicum]|uniref:Bacillithiol system redox-active protein YtxJ n=1 Tax=Flavobacterium turcicum TaxID=2764718 RepID=A0ABR7JE48_9FLAO|nr:bacillithiol system redox-active protein YtxJ [Flavobacterium turcicum]MBC5862732.1 bacillithiol system redox-active protein YtxJ [Flavobacterium turcicum]NHL01464.1 bacillithiol system redox-active protein YtxJ [Flavobacterium turcicum]
MSFLKNIFGSSENQEQAQSKMQWNNLETISQLDELVALSQDKSVVIFKHSTRCSISRMALKQFENEFDFSDLVQPFYLDLIAFREVSNEIAARFGVVHQSPQLILIKEGKAVYNVSHSDIDAGELKTKM